MSSSTLSVCIMNVFFFFFNDTATTEIYTLSLHDALPISLGPVNWTSSFTYTINRNKVVKLLKPTTLSNGLTISQDHLDLVSIGNVKSMIKEGGSMGDLYVTALATDFHGFTIVDYVNNTVSVDKKDRKR